MRRTEWLSDLKIFLCTTEKCGPENWMVHRCFFEIVRSLPAWGFAHIRDQAGCDGLEISRAVKPETEVADVPTPRPESVLLCSLFSSVKFEEFFL